MDRYFTNFPELHTTRLRLRAISSADIADIFSLFSCKDVASYNEMPPFEIIEEASILVRRYTDQYRDTTAIRWGIEWEGKIVGTVGIFSSTPIAAKSECYLSFEISDDNRSKGLAKEAVEAILTFVRNTIQVHKISALVPMQGEAVEKMLAGFSFESAGTEEKYNAFLNKDISFQLWTSVTEGIS